MLGLPVPRVTSRNSDKSGENANISPETSRNIPETGCVGQIEVFCCRSTRSDTQITKLGNCVVKTVSEGSGQALSSKVQLGKMHRIN